MEKGLEGKTHEVWLRLHSWFGLKKRRLKGDLIVVYSFLTRGSREGGADLLSLVLCHRKDPCMKDSCHQ